MSCLLVHCRQCSWWINSEEQCAKGAEAKHIYDTGHRTQRIAPSQTTAGAPE